VAIVEISDTKDTKWKEIGEKKEEENME